MPGTRKKMLSRINGLLFRNPTVMCQLSIAPIILIGVSLYNALAISLAMLLVTTPTLMSASLLGERVSKEYATMVYLLISATFYIPAYLSVKFLFPESIKTLGIYLPMVVVNSIIIVRSKGFANKNKLHWVFLDSLVYVMVFFIETCLISIIREVFGNGRIYGQELNIKILIPGLTMPFSGFILIGLLAALMQLIYNSRSKYGKKGKK